MGNSPLSASNILKEKENVSGRKLLRSIKLDSEKDLENAFEEAKRELLSYNTKQSHEKDYDYMVTRMLKYLTRNYDIGDGILKKQTPLEFAKSLDAQEAVLFIEKKIELLSRNIEKSEEKNNKKEIQTAGKIDKERVKLAKERLIEYRNKGKK